MFAVRVRSALARPPLTPRFHSVALAYLSVPPHLSMTPVAISQPNLEAGDLKTGFRSLDLGCYLAPFHFST